MIRYRSLEIDSVSFLFLQVPHQDVVLLGISVHGVRVMSGELILRGVSEKPFSESDEALPPTYGVIQILCDGELLRLVGSPFFGLSSPTQEENHEDESATESHEKNLPPL